MYGIQHIDFSIIVSIVMIFLSLTLATFLGDKLKSDTFFISAPLIGGILIATISLTLRYVFSFHLNIPYFVERIFITGFLFSIGYDMARIFNKRYIKHILQLSIICAILLLILDGVSYFFPTNLKLYVGTFMFAWNNEIISKIVPDSLLIEDFQFWAFFHMMVLFMFTPIYLRWMEKKLGMIYNPISTANQLPIHRFLISPSKEQIIIYLLSGIIFLIKDGWVQESIPFLFDFVLSMFSGFLFYKISNAKTTRFQQNQQKVKNAGTVGLYGFIIIQFNNIAHLDWTIFKFDIFLLLLTKTFIIGIVSYYAVSLLKISHNQHELMVAIVAGWTFTLNAPVACMHGMRTVVNKYGPSEIILIIPPVILWLVNYIHIGIIYLLP